MKESMNTQELDTYNGNANETINSTSSNEQLIERIAIEDTPFTAIKYKDEWNLVMGKYRINGPFKNKEECEEASKDVSWNSLLKVIQSMIEANLNHREELIEIANKLTNKNK